MKQRFINQVETEWTVKEMREFAKAARQNGHWIRGYSRMSKSRLASYIVELINELK